MVANTNLPKERINALITTGVYYHDPSNARDLDSICTVKAMQCLVRCTLYPSFSEPAFLVAIKLAREKIAQLEYSVNEQLDTTTKYNVNFDVDRTPETICYKELQDLISKLEEEARAKNKPKIPYPANKEDKGKGKKAIAQKRRSSRVLNNKTADSDSSPRFEEEKNVVPPLAKRKRSSEASRAQGPSAAQSPSIPSTNVSPLNIA